MPVEGNDFAFKLQFNQVQNRFPIVRYKVFVSKNGSAMYEDSNAGNNLKLYTMPGIKQTFPNIHFL